MTAGVRLVLLGRQGAGKGTQCVRLSRHYVIPHISTGDMLRAAVREGTEFGRKAKEIMDRGELVSDEIIGGVVDERLSRDGTRERGYILDGFPRTVGQAELLGEITAQAPLSLVIDLVVPTEVVLERLAGRRVCSDCGANYSVETPPKYGWVCDNCGGDVVQRADDTPEAIQKRLDLYERETAPLISWYDERGLLVEVDGLGPAEVVTERLVAAIDARRPPAA
ncbi:MAG TPA: adenylate kinase [Acidimicrobiales bacterium]|nr:adenylate kinase [Acidimicrobiales bacterium]